MPEEKNSVVQVRNPKTGRYNIIDRDKGEIIMISNKPLDGVPIIGKERDDMEHDFSIMCNDQIEKLEKRLTSLKKSFLKEYDLALNVINNTQANENRGTIKIELEDLLNDTAKKASIFYTECMNKIQRVLGKHL